MSVIFTDSDAEGGQMTEDEYTHRLHQKLFGIFVAFVAIAFSVSVGFLCFVQTGNLLLG